MTDIKKNKSFDNVLTELGSYYFNTTYKKKFECEVCKDTENLGILRKYHPDGLYNEKVIMICKKCKPKSNESYNELLPNTAGCHFRQNLLNRTLFDDILWVSDTKDTLKTINLLKHIPFYRIKADRKKLSS